LARTGVDADGAGVPLHDNALRDVEPETDALAGVLGREEGLERTVCHLPRHAPAGIGDLDDDEAFVSSRRKP
jgi:hypothetical protein